MRVPTDTILKACPIIPTLDKLNLIISTHLACGYFNVHPKLQLQTHPIVKSKSWTLPRQHLCSADDDAVRPCCWSFSTISFFSGTLSDIYMYNVISLYLQFTVLVVTVSFCMLLLIIFSHMLLVCSLRFTA